MALLRNQASLWMTHHQKKKMNQVFLFMRIQRGLLQNVAFLVSIALMKTVPVPQLVGARPGV